MLGVKQQVPVWYAFDFSGCNRFPLLIKKCREELLYLVMPEDSSDLAGGRVNEPGGSESRTRAMVKVMFWVVISIAISLAVGKLV